MCEIEVIEGLLEIIDDLVYPRGDVADEDWLEKETYKRAEEMVAQKGS